MEKIENKIVKSKISNKITKYISKKKNICCEVDINRDIIIKEIFDLYIKIASFYNEKKYYLSYINNDIVKFVGYQITLKEDKNINGLKLYDELHKKTLKNKKLSITKIKTLLNEVPLYFLLSLLGYAHMKYNIII